MICIFFAFQYKSALRPPKLESGKDSARVPKLDKAPLDGWKNFTNSEKPLGTMSYKAHAAPQPCYSPTLLSSPHTNVLSEEFGKRGILEIHYLDSSICLPDMTPDLSKVERDEWKQVCTRLKEN